MLHAVDPGFAAEPETLQNRPKVLRDRYSHILTSVARDHSGNTYHVPLHAGGRVVLAPEVGNIRRRQYATHRFDGERKRGGEWDGLGGAKSVDDIDIQTFFTGETNGRIGFVAQNADVVFSELRCWRMNLPITGRWSWPAVCAILKYFCAILTCGGDLGRGKMPPFMAFA